MDSNTSTPPLPISDLHRLQLTYQQQCMTPVSSTCSGSPVESDYCLPGYLPQPQRFQAHHHHQYYSPQPHYSYPQPPTGHYHPQPQYLKSEYAYMPFDMAGIPHAAPQELVCKSDYSDEGGKPGMVEIDQEEVDAIIRSKRKVRDPKACYACHRRKVKCDRNLPCDSCVKRDHPELCSYERPTKKRRLALSNALSQQDNGDTEHIVNSGPNITVPKEQWERLKKELEVLKSQVKEEKEGDISPTTETQSASGIVSQDESYGEREGVHAPSNQMGTMHLGSRSVLAYMIGNRTKSTQDAAMTLLEENILPNLGLDNEQTTYPFVDLWSTDSNLQDVSGLVAALPEDHVCREFWLTYRDIPCTIYPVVPDCGAFDQALNFLLQTRAEMKASGIPLDPNRPYGVSMSWLALLFAVLASGSQSTGRQAKERELTSQVYICCSYQALRMSNFLTHPTLETIETLLIIGNALSYNMNPGVSYILLGMTLRSAFSMGLHVQSQSFSEHETYLRSRIWWALAWQDSHFSVSYDRPSSSILCMPELPFTKQSAPGSRSYVESMTSIIKLTQSILRERSLNPKQAMSWPAITKYKDEVHRIWNEALPRLRNRNECVAMTDHLERMALALHCSYLISEICRPALKEDTQNIPTAQLNSANGKQSPLVSPGVTRRKSSLSSASPGGSTPGDSQMSTGLRAECVKYLEKVVETYVELRSINQYAARSWIGIQRAISAAFLLGVLPETKQDIRILRLLKELEHGIEQHALADVGFKSSVDINSPVQGDPMAGQDRSRESPTWVKSMTKALNALSQLNAALSGDEAGQGPQKASTVTYSAPFQTHPLMRPPMYNVGNMSQGSGSFTSVPAPLQQYPMVYNTTGRGMNGQNMPLYPGPGPQMMSNVSPYPNDSTTEVWNQVNWPERAMEYVQPGLWG